MSAAEHNLDQLLAVVADGRLDELSPAQVAALDEYLHASPEAEARLADVSPPPEQQLSAAVASPLRAEWDAVWDRIDSATSASGSSGGFHKLIRFWRPVSAAAACLFLMLVWRGMTRPEPAAWRIQLSDQVVVHDITVFGDAEAVVDYGDGGGGAMIWVLDDEGA